MLSQHELTHVRYMSTWFKSHCVMVYNWKGRKKNHCVSQLSNTMLLPSCAILFNLEWSNVNFYPKSRKCLLSYCIGFLWFKCFFGEISQF